MSDDLKYNLLKDGYLFIRNIYSKEDIKNADFILKHLHKVGEVKILIMMVFFQVYLS